MGLRKSAPAVVCLCPCRLHGRIDVVFLLFQEKGIPWMGESSFLASWFDHCAIIMGTCVCVCVCVRTSVLPFDTFSSLKSRPNVV